MDLLPAVHLIRSSLELVNEEGFGVMDWLLDVVCLWRSVLSTFSFEI